MTAPKFTPGDIYGTAPWVQVTRVTHRTHDAYHPWHIDGFHKDGSGSVSWTVPRLTWPGYDFDGADLCEQARAALGKAVVK